MKFCEVCMNEISTKDGENRCDDCDRETVSKRKRAERNAQRRARHAAMTDLGLVRVRGALSGVYYE